MQPISPSPWQDEARRVAAAIRRRALEFTLKNNGGYLSQAASSAEILATLYTRVMKLGPSVAPRIPEPFGGVPGPGNTTYKTGAGYNGPQTPEYDRFIVSAVHYAVVIYNALVETGRMAAEGMEQFNQDGSSVEMIGAEHSPGHEVTAGSLGQALSQAAGIAFARKRRGEQGRVWVFMSDGEFQIGQVWEAFQTLVFHKIDNIGVYVDVNGQQCDGKMDTVMNIEPLQQKLEAFGARVFKVDAHDVDALAAPAELAPDGRPLVVLCYSDPCRGFPLLEERRPKLHYLRFAGESGGEKARYQALLAEMESPKGNSKPEILSQVHAKNLVKWAKYKARVLVLSADLTSSVEANLFQQAYPERFISLGIAEQNMLSFAGGLAREGYTPFLHTFAVFLYRRPLDQLAMSICYPNLPVRLIGFLPGITTPGGATHQATDDIAILRALPNMTILECGDATDVESVLDVAQAVNGPVYVRMLRGEIPRLFPQSEPMRFNQARVLSLGDDVTLLTAGICTEEALRASEVLRSRGVGIRHLHITTHKPFTDPTVLEALRAARHGVITMENHTLQGGLGTATAEMMVEHGIGKRLLRLGLNDTYAHGASKPYLMRKYGLDALALAQAVEKLLGRPLKIGEADLQTVRLDKVHSAAKVEAL
ncbi:MAG: transketolase C-terminal domain-containing protein [Anaerolineales bacterium]